MRARVLGTLMICSIAVYGCSGSSSSPPPDARAGDARDATSADRTADLRADVAADGAADRAGDVAALDSAGDGAADAARDGADAGDGATDVAAPTCSDHIKNSDETDVDCGGHCGGCPADKSCLIGADCTFGVCRPDHTCGECNLASDCPGMESECVHRSCTVGVCGMSRDPAGTVLTEQTTGDCQSRQCAADGTVMVVADNSDVPDDRNACTTDTCSNGMPMHTNLPVNSTCGGQNRCNASGQCVGCLVGTDCAGSDTACQTRTCTQGVCGVSFTSAGTALTDPTAGDCKGLQCDGAGNTQPVTNNNDLPVDGNPCTTDECTTGTPSHHPIASGTTCGTGLVCDGANHCVACLSASTCPGTDTDCQTRTCVNGACGVSNTAAGTPTGAQVAKDCKRIECNGTGATFTVPDVTDLPVDNNPCTADVCNADVPSNPALASGASCGTGLLCDGHGACIGCRTVADCPGSDTACQMRTCSAQGQCGVNLVQQGTLCSDNNGSVCNATGVCVGCNVASDCPGGPDTECHTRACNAGACSIVFTGSGTPVLAQTPGDCHQNVCDGSGGITAAIDTGDVFVDGKVCTQDLCDVAGNVSNPPVTTGTTCMQNGGSFCDASGNCVQCLTVANCDNSHDTVCDKIQCVAGACNFVPVALNTPVADTTLGDCHGNVCDGSGGVVPSIDDNDVPVDGNTCTQDVCMSGVATNPTVTPGTACSQNGGTRCDATASCVPSFMVARIGDGTSTLLTSAATPIFVEERLESDGTLARVINVPSTGTSPKPLTLSGTADSEGALALSGDGHSVAIGGYSAAAGTAGVASTAGTATQRGAALVSANGTVDTTTTFGATTFSANNVRSAVSSNGTQIWTAGNGSGTARGVFFTTIGSAASTLIESATASTRACEIIAGQLYCDAANGVQGIFTFGATLPTTATTPTALPGTIGDTNGSYYAFVLLDMVGNDGVLDTMYVADDRATALGGIQKFTFNAGTWTEVWATNTAAATTGMRGLTGYAAGSNVVLLATTASASPTPNAIIRLIDTGTTPVAANVTTLVPAVPGAVTVYRGIALAPQ